MTRPKRTTIPLGNQLSLLLTDDGSLTLFDEVVGESFHSESGAATESRCVFLENSGVSERIQKGKPTSILEIGFGTGLNFLLTADLAEQFKTKIQYFGVDTRFLDAGVVRPLRLESQLKHFNHWVEYFAFVESVPEGKDLFTAKRMIGDFVELRIARTNAIEFGSYGEKFDVIYQDAFSPAGNAELWTESFLKKLHDWLIPGGRLVTYCVKSLIQRNLANVGFEVKKLSGPPGGKREVLVAIRS